MNTNIETNTDRVAPAKDAHDRQLGNLDSLDVLSGQDMNQLVGGKSHIGRIFKNIGLGVLSGFAGEPVD